eukprot:scaffold26622_cov20-Cyclotella_meneghiniana.AAC.1
MFYITLTFSLRMAYGEHMSAIEEGVIVGLTLLLVRMLTSLRKIFLWQMQTFAQMGRDPLRAPSNFLSLKPRVRNHEKCVVRVCPPGLKT